MSSLSYFNLPLRLLPYRLRRRAVRSRYKTMIAIVIILILLITPFYIIYKPPNFVIRYFQRRWPDVLWHVPAVTSKTVALTIDDGPSEFTEQVLDILRANNATATFFIIGAQVSGREQILRNMIRNGNELGNHAMHDEPSRSLSDEALAEQIGAVGDHISAAYRDVYRESVNWDDAEPENENDEEETVAHVRSPPKYFRPGSGFFSERMRGIVSDLGYRLVLGSIYPHDPQIPLWRVNAKHIISMLRPGAIIICHDRRSWTVPMLQKVIPEIRRRGYRIVTVSELVKAGRE